MATAPCTLREDLAAQRAYVESRAPIYARLLDLVIAALDGGLEQQLEAAWRGRGFGARYERPLLLLAALREDALREGEGHPLWRAIGAREPELDAATPLALAQSLADDRALLWRSLAERSVQTNEPSRAVAWLWPAHLMWQVGDDPLCIFDIGASAGLNLIADQLSTMWTTADGEALEVAPLPPILERVGYDLRPLDVLDDADARWLRACIWPGQENREARLDQAIAAFRVAQTSSTPLRVCVASAGEIPRLLPPDAARSRAIAYQTVVRDYLPADERLVYEAGMRAWLEARPPGSAPWVELEVTDEARQGGPPAAITAHVRAAQGVLSLVLAQCESHPLALTIDEAATRAFRAALALFRSPA